MSLLDRFRAGSELNSVGHFTLDEKRAKNKMARFQLVREHDFLLLVAQAVMAAGCEWIEITTSEAVVRLQAGGPDLDADKLERLEDYLFDTRTESVPYYLLGVARNAVTPFCKEEPSISMVEGNLMFEAIPKQPYSDMTGHIQEHLLYSPCDVRLNDRLMPRVELPHGRLLTLQKQETSVLTLVRHGVMVGHKYIDAPVPFKGVFSNPGFRVDASFFNVVEDDLYLEVWTEAEQGALGLVACAANQYKPGDSNRGELLGWLCQALPEPAGSALRNCPLFLMADRDQTMGFKQLCESKSNADPLLYSQVTLNLQLHSPVVLLDSSHIYGFLKRLFPGGLKDASSDYRQLQERLRHVKEWENSPRPTELPPGNYLANDKVNGPDWQAAIGYLGPPGGESHVDMLYQGKLLCSERLEGLPPGATAVINFDEVEINESWTRPSGRRFRSILKSLESYLARMFEGLILEEQSLYPALLAHIEELFLKRAAPLPNVAARLPLFPTLDGETLSFNRVLALRTIAIGDKVELSERIPGHLLPEKVLLYSARHHHLLTTRLGKRLEDLRPLQQRLQKVDRELANPKEPELEREVEHKEKLEREDLKGEIGLDFDRPGPNVWLSIYHRGVLMEEVDVKMTKVVRGYGAVQLERLRPNADWTGIERDDSYKKLLAYLKGSFRKLEESALENEAITPALFMRLLQAYSKPVKDYPDRKYFESTRPSVHYSLAEVQQELEIHGELLFGSMGVQLPNRRVLLRASQYQNLRDLLLSEGLGKFKAGDADEVARRMKLEAGFQAREEASQIKVLAGAAHRYQVQSCGGEVAVGLLGMSTHVDCHYTKRYVCTKQGLLPKGCAAAIDSEALNLSEDFNDAEVPASILDELKELSEKGLLQCAVAPDRDLRGMALEHALSSNASKAFLDALHELPIFPLQGGGAVSLKDLEQEKQSPAYVWSQFPKHIAPDRVVFRATRQCTALIRARTKLNPYIVEEHLTKLDEDRRYLNSLPDQIPSRYSFRRVYETEAGLNAELALMPSTSYLIGRDEKHQPQGHLELASLPVWGFVWPTQSGKRNKDKQPAVELLKTQERWLKDRVNDLYLEWAEELCHRTFSAEEKADVFTAISLTKHEIGSQSDHPQAFLAKKLWNLPLFPCVDGTRVSGEALATRLTTEEGPLEIARERWRAPGHLPFFDEYSVEYGILKSILGEKSLHWYEAPPLVDTQQLKSNVRKVVAWGVAPIMFVQDKLSTLAESLERAKAEREEKKPAPKPEREKKKKKKDKPPKKKVITPEDRFLQKMKSEAKTLLGVKTYHSSDRYFPETKMGNWILGPPVYLTNGVCYINGAHSGVRWLVHLDPDSNSKYHRAARVLLLIHWVDQVNVASEELTDEQERAFLAELAERMAQTFS